MAAHLPGGSAAQETRTRPHAAQAIRHCPRRHPPTHPQCAAHPPDTATTHLPRTRRETDYQPPADRRRTSEGSR
eukprot:5887930-Prorocentrum_lima.AAC.1